jgi:beta-lactamase regulating signal transducer with metallopeptidase domain
MVFYLIYWSFLKKDTHFLLNRIYLILSLIISQLIPFFKTTSPWRTAHLTEAPPVFYSISVPRAASWGMEDILLTIYVIGLLLFLIRFFSHMLKLYQIVKKHPITKTIGEKIVSIKQDCPPFSFFSYIFVNKANLNKQDLRQILAHEQVHIRQYHSLDILLIEIIIILQWFNPFVWPYKSSLKEIHEYLADEGVITQGFNASRYQVLLFEQNIGAKMFEFANNFKKSQIKRRLIMMTKIKSRSGAKMKYLLVLPITLLLVMAFAEPKQVFGGSTAAGDNSKREGTVITGTETTDPVTAEEIEKLKQEMDHLKKEEMLLLKKLEVTENQEDKKKLEETIAKYREKQKQIQAYLVKAGQHDTSSTSALKEKYVYILEYEKKLLQKQESTTDPETRKKIQQLLDDTKEKKQLLIASLKIASNPPESELKAKLDSVKKKAALIEKKLKSTDDPEEKQKLKKMLVDLLKIGDEIKKKLAAVDSTH